MITAITVFLFPGWQTPSILSFTKIRLVSCNKFLFLRQRAPFLQHHGCLLEITAHLCADLKRELLPQHLCSASAHNVNRPRLLEPRSRARKLEAAAQKQQKQHHRSLETGVSDRKRCQLLERGLHNRILARPTLRREVRDVLQERSRVHRRLYNHSLKAARHEQVKSDYEQLRETCNTVIQERDVERQEKAELQDELDNLGQVLKDTATPQSLATVMKEATVSWTPPTYSKGDGGFAFLRLGRRDG
ncbi:uncharacterized protein LOC143481698 [Brachyhypopomus gauderio]|uniref:uncharacterized protein LOC143481698 n=1 Tax=Brachyhypopomus gauderio TaxID=698409 RepID=UPI004042E7E7